MLSERPPTQIKYEYYKRWNRFNMSKYGPWSMDDDMKWLAEDE